MGASSYNDLPETHRRSDPTIAEHPTRRLARSQSRRVPIIVMVLAMTSLVLCGCGHLSHNDQGPRVPPCPAPTTVTPASNNASSAGQATVHLTQADDHTTVRVRVGTTIAINLVGVPCNPRTPIRLQDDGLTVLKPISSAVVASNATATFSAVGPGQQVITSFTDCSGSCAPSGTFRASGFWRVPRVLRGL